MTDYFTQAKKTLQASQYALGELHDVIASEEFVAAVHLLESRAGKIVFTGLGKSSFIAKKLAATFTSLGHTSVFLHPIEAFHGDIGVLSKGDVLVAISFSGETKEVVSLTKYTKQTFGISSLALTGCQSSSLAKVCTNSLVTAIDDEGCAIGMAPMASTTTTLVLGDCLASTLTESRQFQKEDFQRFHPGGSLGLKTLPVSQVMYQNDAIPLVADNVSFIEGVHAIDEFGLGVVGVTNGRNVLCGVMTDGDIRRFLKSCADHHSSVVTEAMSSKPVVLFVESTAYDALQLMEKSKITSVFVTDAKGKVMGFLHMHMLVEQTL